MTLQQLLATLAAIQVAEDKGLTAWAQLRALRQRVDASLDRTDPMRLPVTQAEIDQIIAVQTPLYNTLLTKIEIAGDLLGTDAFH